jgi:hypothetical protein
MDYNSVVPSIHQKAITMPSQIRFDAKHEDDKSAFYTGTIAVITKKNWMHMFHYMFQIRNMFQVYVAFMRHMY